VSASISVVTQCKKSFSKVTQCDDRDWARGFKQVGGSINSNKTSWFLTVTGTVIVTMTSQPGALPKDCESTPQLPRVRLWHAHASFVSTTTKPLPDSATNTDYDTLTMTAFTITPICNLRYPWTDVRLPCPMGR
jgi:hypothetical protein